MVQGCRHLEDMVPGGRSSSAQPDFAGIVVAGIILIDGLAAVVGRTVAGPGPVEKEAGRIGDNGGSCHRITVGGTEKERVLSVARERDIEVEDMSILTQITWRSR